jgi:ABC-type enterobactin transport system permease subunit
MEEGDGRDYPALSTALATVLRRGRKPRVFIAVVVITAVGLAGISGTALCHSIYSGPYSHLGFDKFDKIVW